MSNREDAGIVQEFWFFVFAVGTSPQALIALTHSRGSLSF